MPKLPDRTAEAAGSTATPLKKASCYFTVDNQPQALDTPFYQRDSLPVGQPLPGPAIILQLDSTTVVPPGASFIVDPGGNLVMTLEGDLS